MNAFADFLHAWMPPLMRLFQPILLASALSGCAIVGIFLLRLMLRRLLSPSWRCFLWLPVAILAVAPRLPDLGLGWSLDEPEVIAPAETEVDPLTLRSTTATVMVPQAAPTESVAPAVMVPALRI